MKNIRELHLLQKQKKGFLSFIFSRTGMILLLMLLGVASLFIVFKWLDDYIVPILGGAGLFDLLVVIALCNTDMDSSAKVTWVLVISVTSVFGALFYLYTRIDVGNGTVKSEYERLSSAHRGVLQQDAETMFHLREVSPESVGLVTYMNHTDTFPISSGNEITYYPLGEDMWEDMLQELEKARHFIFMEYFIISEGKMWGSILQILQDKVQQGVDVRVMYDGTCAISKVPYDYPEMLEKLGIKCRMFSPLRPFISTHYNYRDHRKILVIDGKVGFTGGVNLADEYINHIRIFGHWKDTALRIRGEAVRSLTHMFLNLWNYGEKSPEYDAYVNAPVISHHDARGYAMPFGYNPFSRERVGERTYMDILNHADRYVYIMTPYLVLDDEMLQCLEYTARRGVDVRIILPGIPDKKAVYALAKTYIPSLLAAGVKVYFYTPGFVHAKVFVSDDIRAVVGTINLDYRSLYHHFECGVFMYDTGCIRDIKADFAATQAKCEEITPDILQRDPLLSRAIGTAMRLLAPLL